MVQLVLDAVTGRAADNAANCAATAGRSPTVRVRPAGRAQGARQVWLAGSQAGTIRSQSAAPRQPTH
jgi:hypothetical protein